MGRIDVDPLKKFQTDPETMQRIEEFVKDYSARRSKEPIIGPAGEGKTHLEEPIIQKVIRGFHEIVQGIVDAVKRSASKNSLPICDASLARKTWENNSKRFGNDPSGYLDQRATTST